MRVLPVINYLKTSIFGGAPYPPSAPQNSLKLVNLFPGNETLQASHKSLSDLLVEKKKELKPLSKEMQPVASKIILGKVLSKADVLEKSVHRLSNLYDLVNGCKFIPLGEKISTNWGDENTNQFIEKVGQAAGRYYPEVFSQERELHQELIEFYKIVRSIKENPEERAWETLSPNAVSALFLAGGIDDLKSLMAAKLKERMLSLPPCTNEDDKIYRSLAWNLKSLLEYSPLSSHQELVAIFDRLDHRSLLNVMNLAGSTTGITTENCRNALKEVLEQKPQAFRQKAKEYLKWTIEFSKETYKQTYHKDEIYEVSIKLGSELCSYIMS